MFIMLWIILHDQQALLVFCWPLWSCLLTIYTYSLSLSNFSHSLTPLFCMLFACMQICVEHEPGVFFSLLPSLYRCFSKHLFGCQDILYLIVSNIDPAQVSVILYSTYNVSTLTKIDTIICMHGGLHNLVIQMYLLWLLLRQWDGYALLYVLHDRHRQFSR